MNTQNDILILYGSISDLEKIASDTFEDVVLCKDFNETDAYQAIPVKKEWIKRQIREHLYLVNRQTLLPNLKIDYAYGWKNLEEELVAYINQADLFKFDSNDIVVAADHKDEHFSNEYHFEPLKYRIKVIDAYSNKADGNNLFYFIRKNLA